MAQDLDTRWGDRIRKLRQERGWSLFQLGSRTDTEPGHLSRIERGLVRPDDERRIRIAEALDVDPNELWSYPAEVAS